MPSVTSAQRHKLNRDPISDPHIVLLEFQEDGQSAVERAAINTEDVTWNGNTYVAAAINVEAPSSGADEPRARVSASNVDRIIGRAVLAADRRINCRMIVTDASIADSVILDTKNQMVFRDVSVNSEEVSATLGPRMSLLEPVPFQRTTRAAFPGVWL